MADIIDISAAFDEDPDIDTMTADELREYLKEVQSEIESLDDEEPRNMDSEEYEEWSEYHEDLEDLVDDILDRLDEIG